MRVLFTAVPIHGHLLPLLPLAEAALDAGDEVAVAVPSSMASMTGDVPAVACGPDIAELLTENDRRTGGADMDGVGPIASLFAGVRADLTYDEALSVTRDFRPDLLVADEYDVVAPMVASALRIPLAQHAIGLPVSPAPLVPAMRTLLEPRYAARDLAFTARAALIDPWPPALHYPGWTPSADRLPIRPRPYASGPPPLLPEPGARPRVLVTLGTVLRDIGMLHALVDAVAAPGDVDVLATVAPGVPLPPPDPRDNVHFVGFVPMAHLLDTGVAVVVAAGGAGTVLAALSHGIPMVIWPKGAEKPMNADRVAAAGAGLTIADPSDCAAAVRTLLDDDSYRAGAARVAAQIREAPDPAEVWSALRDRASA